MKIYNKKTFAFGIFAVVLALLNLIASIWTGFDVKSIILILLLLFFGLQSMLRGVSRKLTREDKMDELDERNQLIELKSRSKAFQLTQFIAFGLMLFFFGDGESRRA